MPCRRTALWVKFTISPFSLCVGWAACFYRGSERGECACDERDRAESANSDDNERNTLCGARKVAAKSRCDVKRSIEVSLRNLYKKGARRCFHSSLAAAPALVWGVTCDGRSKNFFNHSVARAPLWRKKLRWKFRRWICEWRRSRGRRFLRACIKFGTNINFHCRNKSELHVEECSVF